MKKIYYFLFSILAVAATSCSDDLDIKPTSFISDATVWEDQALINKYVANIYALCCAALTAVRQDMVRTGQCHGLATSMVAPMT